MLRPCPYQRSSGATRPGDNTPRIMRETGAVSHAGPGDRNPALRGHQKGNGACTQTLLFADEVCAMCDDRGNTVGGK